MVKLNKIYTRTGDGGSAGLVDGSRVSKSSLRMAAIGDIDEANAAIGVAIAALKSGEVALNLVRIQNDLFDLGADAATPGDVDGALRIIAGQVARLEVEIDDMNASLEPLTSFTSPAPSSAGPSAPRSRSMRPSRSIRTCSPISTACPTICSSARDALPRPRAATCCGSRARPAPSRGDFRAVMR